MSNATFIDSPWHWPDECCATVREGMKRQRIARAWASEEAPAGWKIAANDPGMRARWKLSHCLYGYVMQSALNQGDTTYRIADFACAAIEPELCISIVHDISGEESDSELASAIGPVRLAAELVDIRGRVDDAAAVIGGNIFHHGLALSTDSTDSRAFGAATMLTASRNDQTVWQIPALTLLPPFATIVRFVSQALRASGEQLRGGQFILSGVLTPLPIWVQPGDQVILGLGEQSSLRLGFEGDAE